MARRRETQGGSIEIEIEPVRGATSAPPHRLTDEVDPASALDDDLDIEQGVQWQIAAVVMVAVFALVAVSVIGLTRRAVDPFAATPSSTTVAEAVPVTSIAVDPTVTAPPTVGLAPEEGGPWPSDVAILVANEHGIDRVTAEKGEVVVTRLDLAGAAVGAAPSVERAFEVQDGSIVLQFAAGDIVRRTPDGEFATLVPHAPGLLLEDADMPGADPGRLRLVYRRASDTDGAAFSLVVLDGATSVEAAMMGGWATSYRRFTFWTDALVGATWVDDTSTRGYAVMEFPSGQQDRGSVEASGAQPLQVAGDPNEGNGVTLTPDGMVDVTSSMMRQVGSTSTVSHLDVRGSSLVVQRDDGSSEYVDLSPFRRFDVPVDGFATVSRFVHSPLVDNAWSALNQDNPRTCLVGLPGNNHAIAPWAYELDDEQIAAADPIVVDGFAALLATLDDGSFVVRITFDACTVHLRGDGITRDVMLGLLTQADVGHVGVFGTDDCPPLASCVPPGTTEPPVETVPPVATVPRP